MPDIGTEIAKLKNKNLSKEEEAKAKRRTYSQDFASKI